jgi:hypothetical protein
MKIKDPQNDALHDNEVVLCLFKKNSSTIVGYVMLSAEDDYKASARLLRVVGDIVLIGRQETKKAFVARAKRSLGVASLPNEADVSEESEESEVS